MGNAASWRRAVLTPTAVDRVYKYVYTIIREFEGAVDSQILITIQDVFVDLTLFE